MLGWINTSLKSMETRDELSTTTSSCRNIDVASSTDRHYFGLQVMILCYKNRGGRGGPGHLKKFILTSQPIIHTHTYS